jgi:hypothetical protein
MIPDELMNLTTKYGGGAGDTDTRRRDRTQAESGEDEHGRGRAGELRIAGQCERGRGRGSAGDAGGNDEQGHEDHRQRQRMSAADMGLDRVRVAGTNSQDRACAAVIR